MENKKVFFYKLYDPRFPNVTRYIGKANNVETRFKRHIKEAKFGNRICYKNSWIISLINSGITPEVEIICEAIVTSKDEWGEIERKLIKQYRDFGEPLTNQTDGGDGGSMKGHKKSSEFCRKLSIAKTGTKHSDKTKEKIRQVRTGTTLSAETKEKLSKIRTGRKFTDESKRKLSQARTGFKMSKEQKALLSKLGKERALSCGYINPNLGKTMSDDVKRKISEKLTGLKQSEETIQKRIESCKITREKNKFLVSAIIAIILLKGAIYEYLI